jgi:2,5-diketo-D-gluconate reductase B
MNFVEANGAKIPAIGLGTMTLMEAVCVEAVEAALCVGYRHIDTAERYRNESEVGEGLRRGLRAAGIKREDVCLSAANSNSITVDGLPVSVSKIELRQSQ